MAIALIASGSDSRGSGSSSVTLNTTGANLIIIISNDYFENGGTISDNKSNTISTAVETIGFFTKLRIRYIENPTVGTGHTFTSSLSGNNNLIVLAYSGAKTSGVLDQTSSSSGASPGSITPSDNNELIVSAVGDYDNGDTWSVDSSFTVQITENAHLSSAAADLVQTTSGLVNLTFSLTGSGNDQRSAIASFKAGSTTVEKTGSETGVGTDAIVTSTSVTSSELGPGTDSLATTPTIIISETTPGSDSFFVVSSVPSNEIFPGSDSTFILVSLSIGETGIGTDLAVANLSTPLAEIYPGIDSVTTSATITASETGIGSDLASGQEAGNVVAGNETSIPEPNVTITSGIQIAESFSGADDVFIQSNITAVELGVGFQLASAQVSVAANQSAPDAQIVQILANIPADEIGAGTDSGIAQAPGEANAYQSGAGTDEAFTSTIILSGETGAGIDTATISVIVAIHQLGVGTDSAEAHEYGTLTIVGKLKFTVVYNNRRHVEILPTAKRTASVIGNGRTYCEVLNG